MLQQLVVHAPGMADRELATLLTLERIFAEGGFKLLTTASVHINVTLISMPDLGRKVMRVQRNLTTVLFIIQMLVVAGLAGGIRDLYSQPQMSQVT